MKVGKRIVFTGFLALSSCAATSRLPPQAPVVPVAGQMTLGRIVAIRQVTVAGNAGASGLNAVLSALNQPAAATPVSGAEVVVQQDNGSTIDIAQTNTAGFSVGDEVGVIVTNHTTLVHR